ncbi:hypothetical protein Tco_0733732 [Tanacetum coccineum]
MVLPDNQVGSPKSVLDGKALEDLSNCSDFDHDLYLNDEEDNGDNVVVLQTSTIKPMLVVATNMSCVIENDIGKEESKDNLKDQEHLDGDALDPWIPALLQGEERSRGSSIMASILEFYKDITHSIESKATTLFDCKIGAKKSQS